MRTADRPESGTRAVDNTRVQMSVNVYICVRYGGDTYDVENSVEVWAEPLSAVMRLPDCKNVLRPASGNVMEAA